MKTFCAVVLEEDKSFLSFARFRKGNLRLLGEKEISLLNAAGFLGRLKANAERIEQAMADFEQKHSLSLNKVFIELPSGLADEVEAQEKIVLPKKKKVTLPVVNSAKKYIENKFLEWNQHCIHHIVLGYQTEGVKTNQAPLGVYTNKLKINSLLVFVKSSFYQEIAGVFYDLERNFAGMAAHKISALSQGFKSLRGSQIVIGVNSFNSYAGIKDEKGRVYEEEFDFSINKIIQDISNHYAVSSSVALQLLERHGSFKEIPYFKEITIKKQGRYLNLSTKALGNFIKKIFSGNIRLIIDSALGRIEVGKRAEVMFSFVGPLSVKDGFYGYVKKTFNCKVETPICKCRSSAFGCLKYNCFKPLESPLENRQSLFKKIKKIYCEYF